MWMFPSPAASCPGLHPALWVLSPFGGPGGGDSAQGYTLRYGYYPPSGDWVEVILPRVTPFPQGFTLSPGLHPALWVLSPFGGLGGGDSAEGALFPQGYTLSPGLHPALWVLSPFGGMGGGDSAQVYTFLTGFHPALWALSSFGGMGGGGVVIR